MELSKEACRYLSTGQEGSMLSLDCALSAMPPTLSVHKFIAKLTCLSCGGSDRSAVFATPDQNKGPRPHAVGCQTSGHVRLHFAAAIFGSVIHLQSCNRRRRQKICPRREKQVGSPRVHVLCFADSPTVSDSRSLHAPVPLCRTRRSPSLNPTTRW